MYQKGLLEKEEGRVLSFDDTINILIDELISADMMAGFRRLEESGYRYEPQTR